MSSKYIRPNFGDNDVIYKGRRFWVIEMTGIDDVDGFTKNDCQFLMFDGVYGATVALIDKQLDGKYKGSLMSHVEIWYIFETLEEAIKLLPSCAESYYKSV